MVRKDGKYFWENYDIIRVDGALAQLIERRIRIAKVRGLIPLRSTKQKVKPRYVAYFILLLI